MGCTPPSGGASPVGWEVIPQIATGVVQYLIMNRMLDAAREAREDLELLAEEMLVMSEELFAEQMMLREYDQQVYDYLKGMPSYSVCMTNVERGELSGKFLAGQLVKQNAFGHSRYNVGNRKAAIQDAINASIISSGEQSVEAYNFEEIVKDAYDQLKWASIASAAAFEFRVDSVFGSVAQSYQRQAQLFNASANGSVAALAYTVSGVLNTFESARKRNALIDEGKSEGYANVVSKLQYNTSMEQTNRALEPLRMGNAYNNSGMSAGGYY